MLKATRVDCGYGQKPVLFDINITIEKRECTGIIGPNGSGKTTLLRLLSRAITPAKGSMMFAGKELTSIPVKDLAREIAVVSQTQPADHMTVEEFVLLGRVPHHARFQFFDTKNDRSAVDKALRLTGTEEFRGRLIGQMSGGERQLVYIARALAQAPQVLLLDEPTTHLDIAHQVKVLDLIRRLNLDLGLTVVMILHDLNLAGEYCHRLVLLDRGRIHTDGTPEDVLTYQTIEEVYRTVVIVNKNPISGKPYVFLVPEKQNRE